MGERRKKLRELIGWQKSQADTKKLQEAGFGDLVAEPPVLCEWAERARHCWEFCGGWAPQSWPVYAALYDVTDWHLLIDLMREIRSHV